MAGNLHPSTFLGMVVRKNTLWKAVRVSVLKLSRDPNLNLYYNRRVYYWAADPDDITKLDDIVMIKLLDEPQSDRVKHYIKKVEFPSGQVIDPLTGRRCRGTTFVNEEIRKLGPSPESHI